MKMTLHLSRATIRDELRTKLPVVPMEREAKLVRLLPLTMAPPRDPEAGGHEMDHRGGSRGVDEGIRS